MQERLQAAEAEVAAGAVGGGIGREADGGTDGGGAGGAAAGAQVAALRAELETLKTSQMPGLPAGWIWQHDPGLNKLFFVEPNTGHVQWEPPPAPDVPVPAEGLEGAAQASGEASGEAAAALERLQSVEAELEETKETLAQQVARGFNI